MMHTVMHTVTIKDETKNVGKKFCSETAEKAQQSATLLYSCR